MKSRNHIIPFLSTSIVPFSQSTFNSFHQLLVHHFALQIILPSIIVIGIKVQFRLLRRFTDFQSEFETIESLSCISISHICQEGEKIGW
jgi:hypothetical protein